MRYRPYETYDVRGSDLATLVMMCLTNNGVVSKHRRKQFQYTVQADVLDYIEEVAQALLRQQELAKQSDALGG